MKKTCLMVLAGVPPSEDLLVWRIEDSDYRIAVDGGFIFQARGQALIFSLGSIHS